MGADFDVELVEMDDERDHAHLLINSSQSGYQQANSLKGGKPSQDEMARREWHKAVLKSDALWPAPYGVGSDEQMIN